VRGDRRLRRQIEDIITAESGASFDELADRTNVAYPDVRTVVWALYGAKRADICWGYVVAVPSAAERGQAA
jgi:hypothetical protein